MPDRPTLLLRLAREIAGAQPDFHAVRGPGEGDRATNDFMKRLRASALSAYGIDLSEFRACGDTSLAVDFYFPEEGVIVEIALGLPNPGSEFEKDILKALMAKEIGHKVEKLIFISRPGAIKKCSQPGRKAVIQWAETKHLIAVEVQELEGKARPPRSRKRSNRSQVDEDRENA